MKEYKFEISKVYTIRWKKYRLLEHQSLLQRHNSFNSFLIHKINIYTQVCIFSDSYKKFTVLVIYTIYAHLLVMQNIQIKLFSLLFLYQNMWYVKYLNKFIILKCVSYSQEKIWIDIKRKILKCLNYKIWDYIEQVYKTTGKRIISLLDFFGSDLRFLLQKYNLQKYSDNQ